MRAADVGCCESSRRWMLWEQLTLYCRGDATHAHSLRWLCGEEKHLLLPSERTWWERKAGKVRKRVENIYMAVLVLDKLTELCFRRVDGLHQLYCVFLCYVHSAMFYMLYHELWYSVLSLSWYCSLHLKEWTD